MFKIIPDKFSILIFLLFSYAVLLVLKLNGYCDYSGKYGIQEIFCYQFYDNSSFVIDGDKKTTWGLTEPHYQNENFIIKFRNKKNIRTIDIINSQHNKNILFPDIAILSSQDGQDWNVCKYDLENNGDKITYNFPDLCKGRYLNLNYQNKKPGYWPISEIKIYDK